MTRCRPETRARAVLALLDPWLDRVDRGLGFGDVDLARTRSRLGSLVHRVRAVAVRGEHPDLVGLTIDSRASSRHAAIDALLSFARSSHAPGISPAEVEAKTSELTSAEDAAFEDGSLFVQRLLEQIRRAPARAVAGRFDLDEPVDLGPNPANVVRMPGVTSDQARAMTDRVMGAS